MPLKPDLPSPDERARLRRQRSLERDLFDLMARRFPDLRRRRGPGGQAAPVDPIRPNRLTGGAAAALDFGQD